MVVVVASLLVDGVDDVDGVDGGWWWVRLGCVK